MSRNLALFLVASAGICWASSGVAVQDFFSHSNKSAMELTNIRMCMAGFLMLVITILRKRFLNSFVRLNRHKRFWFDVLLYGIIGIVMVQFTYFQAISIGGAAATTVILSATPAMVVIWESFYNKKLPTRGEIFAVVLVIVGVFFLVTGGNIEKLVVPLPCIFWSLASGATFAFSMIFVKHLFAARIEPIFLTSCGMFLGGLFTFFLIDDFNLLEFFKSETIFDIVWIIIFGTVVAFMIFNAGLRYLTPEETAITGMAEPASSVVISYFVFGTTFGFIELLGIILVLIAIISPIFFKKFF